MPASFSTDRGVRGWRATLAPGDVPGLDGFIAMRGSIRSPSCPAEPCSCVESGRRAGGNRVIAEDGTEPIGTFNAFERSNQVLGR